MRILLAAPGDEAIGGVPSVIGDLARYQRDRGHDVVFLYPGQSVFGRRQSTPDGFKCIEIMLQMPLGDRHPVISLLIFLLRFPVGMFQLTRFIRRNRIEVVNVHYPGETAWYLTLCRRMLSIPLVTSVHGADLFPKGKPMERYSRALLRVLRSSDRVVVPSEAFQKEVAAVFPFLARRLMSIHNGVDLSELEARGRVSPPEVGIPFLLSVAMHNEKKGLDVLLRAFARVRKAVPDLKLLLVGDGPLREELETLASALDLTGCVRFLGRRNREEVVSLFQACELFVLPSRSEPFGIVLLEALACRKPVIATRVGGIPEIIEDGKHGLLVEPDDSDALAAGLLKLLEDPALRKTLADNGYARVQERFSSERTGASYEDLFRRLSGAGPSMNA